MAKLDRLDWVAGFAFLSFGIRVGIRTNKPELLQTLTSRLPIGWKPLSTNQVDTLFSLKVGGTGKRPGLRQFHLAYGNFIQLARTHSLETALDAFERDLQIHIAENAITRIFVHAGVVSWQGTALLIPGRSLSGKSTLVRELVKAGATYYSDEYAVLDSQGRVHPYPTPIGVRTNPLEKQLKYPIETFGGKVGKKPLPVGLVLVTNYQEGARWKPKRISPGQGLLALLTNTISAQRDPQKAMTTLERVVSQAPTLKSVRGETGEVVEMLLNHPWPTL
jgi:hypothetical protein